MILAHWLILSSVLFSIALYGILTRRNAVGVLISVEIALNAVALNFVAADHFHGAGAIGGQIMAMFIIGVAAAEVVTAVAIFISFYRARRSVEVIDASKLKG